MLTRNLYLCALAAPIGARKLTSRTPTQSQPRAYVGAFTKFVPLGLAVALTMLVSACGPGSPAADTPAGDTQTDTRAGAIQLPASFPCTVSTTETATHPEAIEVDVRACIESVFPAEIYPTKVLIGQGNIAAVDLSDWKMWKAWQEASEGPDQWELSNFRIITYDCDLPSGTYTGTDLECQASTGLNANYQGNLTVLAPQSD